MLQGLERPDKEGGAGRGTEPAPDKSALLHAGRTGGGDYKLGRAWRSLFLFRGGKSALINTINGRGEWGTQFMHSGSHVVT